MRIVLVLLCFLPLCSIAQLELETESSKLLRKPNEVLGVLVRTDASKKEICWNAYSYGFESYIWDAVKLHDGGYAFIGNADSCTTARHSDFWMGVTDPRGNLIWEKCITPIDTPGFRGANKLLLNSAHQFIVVGEYSGRSGSHGGIWVTKLNENGEKLWSVAHGVNVIDSAGYSPHCVAADLYSDEGFVLVGNCTKRRKGRDGQPNAQAWILRTDRQGQVIWCKRFGDEYFTGFQDVKENEDHRLIAVGEQFAGAEEKPDGLIVVFDENGEAIKRTVYGGINSYTFESIDVTPDGQFLATGTVRNRKWPRTEDFLLLKLDSSADSVWSVFFDNGDFVFIADSEYVVIDKMSQLDGHVTSVNVDGSVDNDATGYWAAVPSCSTAGCHNLMWDQTVEMFWHQNYFPPCLLKR